MYNSQAGQDKFILKVLKNKKDGYFLEIANLLAIYKMNI